jgi:hypothetical protein
MKSITEKSGSLCSRQKRVGAKKTIKLMDTGTTGALGQANVHCIILLFSILFGLRFITKRKRIYIYIAMVSTFNCLKIKYFPSKPPLIPNQRIQKILSKEYASIFVPFKDFK